MARTLASCAERQEAEVEAAVAHGRGVSRASAIASSRGRVGKTTWTFLLGDLMASRLAPRAIAVDANPEFGTLAGR